MQKRISECIRGVNVALVATMQAEKEYERDASEANRLAMIQAREEHLRAGNALARAEAEHNLMSARERYFVARERAQQVRTKLTSERRMPPLEALCAALEQTIAREREFQAELTKHEAERDVALQEVATLSARLAEFDSDRAERFNASMALVRESEAEYASDLAEIDTMRMNIAPSIAMILLCEETIRAHTRRISETVDAQRADAERSGGKVSPAGAGHETAHLVYARSIASGTRGEYLLQAVRNEFHPATAIPFRQEGELCAELAQVYLNTLSGWMEADRTCSDMIARAIEARQGG